MCVCVSSHYFQRHHIPMNRHFGFTFVTISGSNRVGEIIRKLHQLTEIL